MALGPSPRWFCTALVSALVVLVLTPAAAIAGSYACGGAISAPDMARQGSIITVTATAVEGEHFEIELFGGEGDSFLGSGDVSNNGNFDVDVQVPVYFAPGGATIVMAMVSPSTCDYGSGITILPPFTVNPGITITIPPAPTTTTTPAPQSSSTTTLAGTTTTTTTTTTIPAPSSTSTDGPAETTTSAGAATTALDSTATSLVATAIQTDSGGGQPWSAWVTGGLIGLMLGGAGMLALIRKGVLKI